MSWFPVALGQAGQAFALPILLLTAYDSEYITIPPLSSYLTQNSCMIALPIKHALLHLQGCISGPKAQPDDHVLPPELLFPLPV